MSKLQSRFISQNIRRLIDLELDYFKFDQPPENNDVRKGIDRAEIAISRAFRKFETQGSHHE
jgi:hypothetical protein